MSRITRIAALGLLMALAACGSGGGSTAPTPAEPNPPVPPTAPAPTPPAAPAPAPTALGVVLGDASSAEIGPAGGSLESPDGSLRLTVPPGAFDRVRTVAITPISNQAHGGLGVAWRITPEGLDTPVPMTLEWRYPEAQVRGMSHLNVAVQGADGVWRTTGNLQHDAAQRTLRVQTTHFSDWSFVAGVQLRPGTAEVQTGRTLELTVRHCASGADASTPGRQQLFACEDDGAGGIATSGWAVNGAAGGDSSVGQLSGSSAFIGKRLYTAPPALPAQNPVAVSVRYTDPFTLQQETLVSNLTVIDPAAGCEWWAGVNRIDVAYAYDYQWSGSDDHFTQRFRQRADTRGTLVRSPQTPIGQVWFEGHLTSGTVFVDNETTSKIVPERSTVQANGSPIGGGDLPPLVRLFIRLDTCTVIITADAEVTARHESHTNQGSFVLDATLAGGAIAVLNQPIEGRREFVADTTLPAYQQTTGMAWFSPQHTHHDFPGQIGSAQVRYAFRPQ
jgi:hypothetical protein